MAIWTEIGKNLVKEGVFENFPDLKEGIFERFPELIPAVGEPNYWKGEHSKLLLVGESNYFEDKFESISDFKDFENWYTSDNCRLIPEDKKNDVSNWKGGGGHNNIFRSMKKVLNEMGIENFDRDLLWEAAYYNYFLRPASVTKTSKCFDKDCKEIDCQVSYLALRGIIDEIEPDIVIFVSKFSYRKFKEYYEKELAHYDGVVVECANHFSNACWRESDGQQKFENLLREYWFWGNDNCQKLRTIHYELRQIFKIEKELECFFDEKGNYLSCLYFKLKDSSFCCETGVKMNDNNFWTCFYKTEDSIEIPALKNKDIKRLPDVNNDEVVAIIENQIRQIIEEIS